MEPGDTSEIYETALTRCWWGDDGILYSVSKPAERNIENYQELFVLYAKLSDNGNRKFSVLGDVTKTRPLSRKVREFVAQESAKYIKAMALVSDSTIGTATSNLYQILSRTPYQIGTFRNHEDAIKWLRENDKLG